MEILLHRIPRRMCLNGSSDLAMLFTKQGRKGINQDVMVVWENFSSKEDAIFCGVFDGHGPFGYMVANKKIYAMMLHIASTPDRMHVEKHNEIFSTLKDAFLRAFKVVDRELKLHPRIDCYYSGTTAVTLVKQGQDLVIGNIGDSGPVLGTRDKDDSLVAVQLTVDLKPSVPIIYLSPSNIWEAERIRLCKGRVFSLKAELEVTRVGLANVDSPSLAMARAFGDFCQKDFGLISVPEITHRRLTKEDEFIILATNGIWDVLSNEEVVNIVASIPPAFVARSLVETVVQLWRLKFPTSKVDDCAIVCLFLDSAPNEISISTANQKTMPDLLDACSDMHAGALGLGNLDYYWTIKDFIQTDGGHPQWFSPLEGSLLLERFAYASLFA
ncbi:hypothetical protein UlMin_011658 [Ulmus minor]